jgi:hypothetical protein
LNKEREYKTLKRFIEVYCRENHGTQKGTLCDECDELLTYACKRLERCPYDPKPKCKDCKTHCYIEKYRNQIKEVMKFSGIYHVKRGRVDWLIKYFM